MILFGKTMISAGRLRFDARSPPPSRGGAAYMQDLVTGDPHPKTTQSPWGSRRPPDKYGLGDRVRFIEQVPSCVVLAAEFGIRDPLDPSYTDDRPAAEHKEGGLFGVRPVGVEQ